MFELEDYVTQCSLDTPPQKQHSATDEKSLCQEVFEFYEREKKLQKPLKQITADSQLSTRT